MRPGLLGPCISAPCRDAVDGYGGKGGNGCATEPRMERQIMPIPVRPSAPRQARQRSAYRACSHSVHPTRTMSSSIAFAARHRWWGIRIIRPSPYMGVRTIGYAHTRPGLFGSPHLHAPRLRHGYAPARRVLARRSDPRASGGRFMHDPASDLPRKDLPKLFGKSLEESLGVCSGGTEGS